jgi:hypothetical protein
MPRFRPFPFVLAAVAALVALAPDRSAGLSLPALAPAADVAAIVREFDLPPIHPGKAEEPPLARTAFPAAALKGYAADATLDEIRKPGNEEKHRFRLAVLDAFGTIRGLWAKGGPAIRKEFVGPPTPAVKKAIREEQLAPARAIMALEEAVDRLEAVGPLRANEPKRWQAHYDYALAQALARLAFLHEYNRKLGDVRNDNLPDLDPAKGEDGYKLVSSEEIRAGDIRRTAKRARERFADIAADHKGTPWAVQAKRDAAVPLGLRWVPFNSKAAGKPE